MCQSVGCSKFPAVCVKDRGLASKGSSSVQLILELQENFSSLPTIHLHWTDPVPDWSYGNGRTAHKRLGSGKRPQQEVGVRSFAAGNVGHGWGGGAEYFLPPTNPELTTSYTYQSPTLRPSLLAWAPPGYSHYQRERSILLHSYSRFRDLHSFVPC